MQHLLFMYMSHLMPNGTLLFFFKCASLLVCSVVLGSSGPVQFACERVPLRSQWVVDHQERTGVTPDDDFVVGFELPRDLSVEHDGRALVDPYAVDFDDAFGADDDGSKTQRVRADQRD